MICRTLRASARGALLGFCLATASPAPAVAHALTKAIVEGAEALHGVHPRLAEYDPSTSADARLNGQVPLHPGAAAYYRERGML